MTNLTIEDLHATLENPDHLGWGYACCEDLSERLRHNVDVVIVRLANEQGWRQSDLFHWSNSKHGRWLSDHLTWQRSWSQKQLLADQGIRNLISLHGLEEVLEP